MPMRREQVAAALRYLQDKADLRGRLQRATSLDPQEQDLADIAVETGASLVVPGVGPALAARDFERARRANDPVGMGMAAASAVPGGKLAGLLKRYDPTRLELDVYHGTPHRFPATEANPLGEFDASKIGTGEGAQAYGHGVYLAENPEIARGYQKDLSNYTQPFIQFKGQKIAGTSLSDLDIAAYKYLQTGQKDAGQFPHNTVYYAKKAVENAPDKYWTEKFSKEEILKRINEFGSNVKFGEEKNVGAFYKADLPDEMIDRMLDWDKPIKDQPEAVRKAIDRIESEFSMRKQPYKDQEGTGFWYGALTDTVGGQQNASKLLKEYGVPGIKYADAGSRGQGGSGTRNFVVFPGEEKKVRILERDGQKAPPQKIAQALESAPRKPEMAFDAPEVKPGDIVDGLKVRPEVANVGSIKASLDNYTVLPGIRSVSIADFGEAGPLTSNVEKLDRRTRNLADQITESKEITPLIVVYSGSQNYILEGSHRIDALDALGKKRIPVIAVIDEDDPPKFMRQKR